MLPPPASVSFSARRLPSLPRVAPVRFQACSACHCYSLCPVLCRYSPVSCSTVCVSFCCSLYHVVLLLLPSAASLNERLLNFKLQRRIRIFQAINAEPHLDIQVAYSQHNSSLRLSPPSKETGNEFTHNGRSDNTVVEREQVDRITALASAPDSAQ